MNSISDLDRNSLIGVWHALLVPWDNEDRADLDRLAAEVTSFGDTGIDGVYTGGTSGEFYAQDDETFMEVSSTVISAAHSVGLPVQIGCTALSTRTTCLRIRNAVRLGADAVQLGFPFWLELNDSEMLDFVETCANAAHPKPLILYITKRSKRQPSVDLLIEMADRVPSFIGTKDTGATVERVRRIASESDIAVFGSEDFFEKLPAGGRGGYCSLTGLNPAIVSKLYKFCETGNYDQAKPLHDQIERLFREVLKVLVSEEGLWDSAVDRVQRAAGGGAVGLRCQRPYASATQHHVDLLLAWCRTYAPDLLPI